ncbi:MAG: endonuclease [Bacilli bacterium]|nr:endonuclease [Bacilli bacterium]
MCRTTKLLFSVGALSLLSSLFIGLRGLAASPIEVSAQILPTNVNVTDLTDAQVNAYYSGVSGKSGDQLVSALNSIIDGHREYNYDSDTDRYAYKIMDRNWTLSPLSPAQLSNFNYATDMPYIRKFYASYNDSDETADLFKNVNASRVSFDKEHIWAQSMGNFGRIEGAGADFHMLVPSDVDANQDMHSNYNFASPTSNVTQYYGEPTQTKSNWTQASNYVGRNGYISGYSQKVCEPRDEYKGDVARAMLYMPARYYTYEDEYHPKLVLVNGSPSAVTASPTQPGLAGDLATLLLWNELDPVDEYEIHRNNLIYNNFQLNRNPFIDHPEWARIAYDTAYSGPGASIAAGSSSVGSGAETIYVSSITLNATTHSMETSAQFSLSATILPANATNKNLTWNSSNESVATVSSDGLVTAVANGSATITAAATDGSGKTATCVITVAAEAKNLLSISVSGANPSTPFASDYSTASITVTAHYDDSSTSDVTSQATINVPNTQVLGKQAVLVSYEDKSTTFDVTVTNNGASGYLNIPSVASDLFISEYIEGSSNNKAIEIFNGTGIAVDLSNYSLFQNNAGGATTTYSLALSGTIQNNSTFVVANNSASNEIKALANLTTTSSVMAFNGNDAVVLQKSGSNIDVVGTIGSSTIFAENVTLVRKSSVSSPTTTYSSSEWDSYSSDTFSYLGAHSFAGGSSGDITASEQAIAWAQYFLNTTGPTCLAMTGDFSSYWTNLADEYGYMVIEAKDIFVENAESDATIASAKARYEYIVQKYGMANFVTDGSGAKMIPTEVTNHISKENDLMVIIAIITIISGTSVCAALLLRNKKRSSLH